MTTDVRTRAAGKRWLFSMVLLPFREGGSLQQGVSDTKRLPRPTAQEIVDKVTDESRVGFDSGTATVRLRVTDRRGNVKEQVVKSEADKKDGLRRARITFLDPADVKGTVLLSLERKEGDDLQYLYLPALRRTRRIAGSAKQGRFMGTDFSYADLEFRDMKEGDLERMADEKAAGRDAFVVEVKPKASDEAYSRLLVWVDKTLWLALKMDFYDRRGRLLKTLSTQAIKKRKTGKAYSSRLKMKNVQDNTSTVILVESLEDDATLADSLFDSNLLGR